MGFENSSVRFAGADAQIDGHGHVVRRRLIEHETVEHLVFDGGIHRTVSGAAAKPDAGDAPGGVTPNFDCIVAGTCCHITRFIKWRLLYSINIIRMSLERECQSRRRK